MLTIALSFIAFLSPAADVWHYTKRNIHTAAQPALSSWTLPLHHTHKLLSLTRSQSQARCPLRRHSFFPGSHFQQTPLRSALTELFFCAILGQQYFLFSEGRAVKCYKAASPFGSPVSSTCHSVCVCSDVWRALSAAGLCLFYAAHGPDNGPLLSNQKLIGTTVETAEASLTWKIPSWHS